MMTFSQLLSLCAFLAACTASVSFGQTPQDPQKITAPASTLTAEVWPHEIAGNIASKVSFEQVRAQQPSGEPEVIALNGLAIPARDRTSMVRVAGVLNAPVTGNYAFLIHAPGQSPALRPDETELWILDDKTGAWRLAQTTGNPVKRSGRTRLEQGVPRRFELWTMGKAAVSVDWEVSDKGPKGPVITLPRQLVPAAAITPRSPAPDERSGDGLRDSWKQRNGLALEKSIGPDSPWGDIDRDGLPNWQEQQKNLHPRTSDCKGAPGIVLWELWRDIPGQYVFDLRRAPHFPTGSREIRYLDRLEIPTGNGNHYGSRLRGLLVAPTDGDYTFKITAASSAELWLGTDENWQTKRLVAHSDQRTTKPIHPEQSATIALKAGQKYYLEVLYKQDTSTDRCDIAWKIPGSEKEEIITSPNLISWKPCPTDTDDDGLPDEWQRSTGLLAASIAPSVRHGEADADFDGATNRDEWLAGTNPLNGADLPSNLSLLTSQSWSGLPGHHIDALVKHPSYPANPTSTNHIDNLDFKQEGDNYGVRIRGYLTAPESGDFSFSLSGNNSAILYLAESEDKFTKRIVSQVEVGTNWRSFHPDSYLRSGSIKLERGKKYYIEVIYKRGVNGKHQDNQIDHSSVAWVRPGRQTSVIAPEFFTPYQNDPRDRDDDDLPDDIEKLHCLDPTDPSGNNGAWGDPDGDGLENLREFQLGLNPSIADVHEKSGLALWEGWHNIEGLIPAHNDRGGLAPALLSDLRFPLQPSSREWRNALDAPRRQGTNFGARLRAHIVAPVTGEYIFSIAGRDVGELFLSSDQSKFKRRSIASFRHSTTYRSWDKRADQMSAPIRLEAGKTYYIEALYARGAYQYNDDFFSIGWKIPQAKEFSLINAKHLIAFHRDPNDQDDDDLPDDWEIRYSLDATNPRGDHGPHGDPDRDSLKNIDELRLGTNPTSRDTDGDGIADYDELHTYNTNPLVKDTIPPKELVRFPLSSARFPASVPWIYGKDGSITSTQRRGSLSFEFDLEKPGIYAVTFSANSTGSSSYVPAIPVSVTVDGVRIGYDNIPSVSTSRTWLTPYLSPGRHTVILENHNVRANVGITIHSLTLSHFVGKDANAFGIPQWLADSLARKNSASTLPAQSAVSPCFIEGLSRFAKTTTAAVRSQQLNVNDYTTSHWYADVPLLPDGSPTKLDLHFENGTQRQSHEIIWTPTNLAAAPATNHLRLGDSIRVTAYDAPGDTFTLKHGDKTWNQQSSAAPVVITFDQVGSFTLTASWGKGSSASVTYHVHSADFGDPIAVAAGGSRVWTPRAIAAPLEIQAEEGITLTRLDSGNAAANTFRINNATSTSGPRGLAARLPGNGPILATGSVHSFLLSSGSKTADSHLVGVLPDGTRVVEVTYIIDGPVPADLSIWIRLYVTDAIFANGLTWMQLTAADFDENGVAKFRVFKAPGTGTPYVCHWILPYADFEDVLHLRQPR